MEAGRGVPRRRQVRPSYRLLSLQTERFCKSSLFSQHIFSFWLLSDQIPHFTHKPPDRESKITAELNPRLFHFCFNPKAGFCQVITFC